MFESGDLQLVQALSGRILATLNKDEIGLLHRWYEQGRKLGVKVNVSYPGFGPGDLPVQFKAVVRGDKNVPIWRENSVVSVVS